MQVLIPEDLRSRGPARPLHVEDDATPFAPYSTLDVFCHVGGLARAPFSSIQRV